MVYSKPETLLRSIEEPEDFKNLIAKGVSRRFRGHTLTPNARVRSDELPAQPAHVTFLM